MGFQNNEPEVTVELFGMARHRAGKPSLTVRADTFDTLLDILEQECPELAPLRMENGGLAAQYLLSVDGEQFVQDLTAALKSSMRVLLLSADVGG